MQVWKESCERISVPYNKDNTLICIEYPGIVQNTQKALETLGGQVNISKVYSDSSKRLPLCWRPDDVYCKPAYGDRHKTNNLLLRVRRRRKKTDSAQYEYKIEILGCVPITFKFTAICDHQYLPVQKKEDGQYESIYDKVVLNKLTTFSEYFNRDMPLFMPPLLFSRVDTPCDFLYRPDIEHREGYKNPDDKRAPNLIGTVRQKRTIYTIFVNFGEPVPEKPIEAAVKRLSSRFVSPEWETRIRKLFEEKPMFLKVEIQRRSGLSSDKLKVVLPALCYYWLDGPWRAQWTIFGFDPTKDAAAKVYQTLDFRIRAFKPGQKVIKAKRATQESYKKTQQVKAQPLVAKINVDAIGQGKDEKEGLTPSISEQEIYYKFFPDKLPPHRLMYYQLCHIELDEVKKLIHENDGKETACTEKDGWCIKELAVQCRDIMYKYTEKLLTIDDSVQKSFAKRLKYRRKHKKIPKQLEESDEGDNEDNDDDNDIIRFKDPAGSEMETDEG